MYTSTRNMYSYTGNTQICQCSAQVCACARACVRVCTCLCMRLCVFISIWDTHTYVYIYTYIYIIYVYIYTYIYIIYVYIKIGRARTESWINWMIYTHIYIHKYSNKQDQPTLCPPLPSPLPSVAFPILHARPPFRFFFCVFFPFPQGYKQTIGALHKWVPPPNQERNDLIEKYQNMSKEE